MLTSGFQPPSIPDHELLMKIGGGSYGEVWLARNVMGTIRAVKIVYRKTFEDERPYEREYAGIQKFEPISRSHDGFVDILQIGRNDAAGYFYYVMELADPVISNPCSAISHPSPAPGENSAQPPPLTDSLITDLLITDYSPRTLRSDLKRRGRLPVAECVHIGRLLASALGHLHQQRLVHRDIKPSNIIFVNGVPKLADIGLVTEAGDERSVVGTDGYIAPEGPGTPQADLYSLGKVLYELSTGKDRKEYPVLPPDLRERPESEQHAFLELNAVLVKACATDARERYQSAEALSADLALLQQGESVKRQWAVKRRLALAKKLSVAALAVAVAGTLVGLLVFRFSNATVPQFSVSSPTTPLEVKAIAVLPFDNEGAEKGDEYLGAQIAEELSSALTRISEVRVMGRATAAALKKANDLRGYARELKLRAVLTGRVRKSGDRLRVSAELIDPTDDALVWSEVYDRVMPEIFALETDMVQKLTDTLHVNLSPTQRAQLAIKSTKNLEAHQAYWEGRFVARYLDQDGLERAVSLFERAVNLDTNFALAWVALADSYILLGQFSYMAPKEAFPKAKHYAQQALARDARLAEAHAALGKAAHIYDWDWRRAELEFKRAFALNPNYPPAHQWYSAWLLHQGRFAEAIREIKFSRDLDPASLSINLSLGGFHIAAGRYEEGLAFRQRTIDLDPNFAEAYYGMAWACQIAGKNDEAMDAFIQMKTLKGASLQRLAAYRSAYAAEGIKGFLKMELENQLESFRRHGGDSCDIVSIYAVLGENDAAFEWLSKAFEERQSWVTQIQVEPNILPLHSDPRFAPYLKRVGLAK